MSAREIYEKAIRQLPAIDRLRLASLILNDLAAADAAGIDVRDDWSGDGIVDLTTFSLQSASGSATPEDTGT